MNDYQVDTADLQTALETALSQSFGRACRIADLQRTPGAYRSSFALEAVDVTLDDGLALPLIFKDLSQQSLSAEGQRAKPAFLYQPQREIMTYQQILADHLPEAARCYGAVVDAAQDRYWLFLEKVPGVPLFEVGLVTWQQVAHWLALMHTRLAQPAIQRNLAGATYLLRYDRDFYWRWPRRAQVFLQQMEPALPPATLAQVARVVEGYGAVVERLLALPVTLMHGEFYAANVLVQDTTDTLRVCPVDWEMAALGPGLLDLAALIAGHWTVAEKRAMALTYYAALVGGGDWCPTVDEFLLALDCGRLHIACQWLGWSSTWRPPAHQAQQWLHELLTMVTNPKGTLCHIL